MFASRATTAVGWWRRWWSPSSFPTRWTQLSLHRSFVVSSAAATARVYKDRGRGMIEEPTTAASTATATAAAAAAPRLQRDSHSHPRMASRIPGSRGSLSLDQISRKRASQAGAASEEGKDGELDFEEKSQMNLTKRILYSYLVDRKSQAMTRSWSSPSNITLVLGFLRDVAFSSRKCHLTPSEDLDLLLSDAKNILPFLSVRELSNVAWYLALLHEFSEVSLTPLINALLLCFTPEAVSRAQEKDVARVVWMMSKVGMHNEALYAMFAEKVIANITKYSLHNISLIAWGFAKARIPAEDLFTAIKDLVDITKGGQKGKEYACLAAAFESRTPADSGLLLRLASYCKDHLATYNDQSFANFLGSFAIAGLYPEELFRTGLREVLNPARSFSPRELLKLIITFTSSQLPCDNELGGLVHQALHGLAALTPHEAALLAWSLSSNSAFKDHARLSVALAPYLSSFDAPLATQVVLLFSFLRLRHPKFPELLVERMTEHLPTTLAPSAKTQHLMFVWSLNVIKRDLRSELLEKVAVTSRPRHRSTLGSLRPPPESAGPANMGERARALLLRLSGFLPGLSEKFVTSESLEGYTAHDVSLLAAAFALGCHNREAFLGVWVPRVLETLGQESDENVKETLLLLLSSHILFGVSKGLHFSEIVDKISAVASDYQGRDLAHLCGLVGLASLKIPGIKARAEADLRLIDPDYHELLLLSRSHFVSKVAPESVVCAHKALLEDCVNQRARPSVRNLLVA